MRATARFQLTESASFRLRHSFYRSGYSGRGPQLRGPYRGGRKYKVGRNHARGARGAGTPAENLLKNLSGTNSIAYTMADPVALAKALTNFQDVPAFPVQVRPCGRRVISIKEIQQLASLPVEDEHQQDHVPAERASSAHRHGSERIAAIWR